MNRIADYLPLSKSVRTLVVSYISQLIRTPYFMSYRQTCLHNNHFIYSSIARYNVSALRHNTEKPTKIHELCSVIIWCYTVYCRLLIPTKIRPAVIKSPFILPKYKKQSNDFDNKL